MNTIFIISGHGNYATGLQSTIELLIGKNNDLNFIDFTVDDSDVNLKEKMQRVIDDNLNSQILFICDIFGGTPFKVAAELANYNDNMEVVAGCNIGSIIESTFQIDNLSIIELAHFIVNASKNSTVRFEKVKENVILNEITEDGI